MPDIREDIKSDVRICGHSIADLSRKTGIEYRRLSGALNGYWYLRPEEESKIRAVITGWKMQIRELVAA